MSLQIQMSAIYTGVKNVMDLVQNSKFPTFTFIVFSIITVKCTSEVARPRGVSLSRAALYNPAENFLCFDNTKTIPFNQVNDDYCDCLDGSDEPGTSACSNGIFYCTNAGHKPLNLPSSRVNDGVCDCCDGSDEHPGNIIKCPNICQQLGKHAREEAQRWAELLKAGKQLRSDLSQRGAQIKEEKKTKLLELQKNREEADRVKEEKKQIKDDIEALENAALDVYRKLEEEESKKRAEAEAAKNREEATETFKKYDSNQDGVLTIPELQTRQTFDKDKNGEVSIEEAKYFLNNEESVDLEKFITDAWTNIKPYLLMDSGLVKPLVTQEENPSEVEELENEDANEDTELTDDEQEEDGEEDEAPAEEDQVEDTPTSSKYDDETQKLVDHASSARNEFANAEKVVRDIDSEIKNIQDYLEKDFGSEEEFASLDGECFEYTDHEYIYKLCPFEKTSQQPKSSSGETRLGSWGKWNGPDSNKYESMLYDRGQTCWNGPQRSSIVKIVCGVENKVVSVSEPNRCEYLFEFITPAACKEVVNEADDLHDEL